MILSMKGKNFNIWCSLGTACFVTYSTCLVHLRPVFCVAQFQSSESSTKSSHEHIKGHLFPQEKTSFYTTLYTFLLIKPRLHKSTIPLLIRTMWTQVDEPTWRHTNTTVCLCCCAAVTRCRGRCCSLFGRFLHIKLMSFAASPVELKAFSFRNNKKGLKKCRFYLKNKHQNRNSKITFVLNGLSCCGVATLPLSQLCHPLLSSPTSSWFSCGLLWVPLECYHIDLVCVLTEFSGLRWSGLRDNNLSVTFFATVPLQLVRDSLNQLIYNYMFILLELTGWVTHKHAGLEQDRAG